MPEPVVPKNVTNTLIDAPATHSSVTDDTDSYRTGAGDEEPSNPRDLLAPPQTNHELGRLAQYRVLKELGRGGMGMVLLAEDSQLLRMAALKIMLPKFAQQPMARNRFLREARAAAKIHHDNVVTIFQVGEERGMPFIAMEYLKGVSLEQYIKERGDLSIAQAVRIGREMAEGLQAAHAVGLIHRDIKPANVWLEAPKGRVKILDFGLARQEREGSQITGSGAVVGTPSYMSPEQARGESVDQRSDLFSLGVVLYRLCTGTLPFTGANTLAVLTALAVDEPKPVRQLSPQVSRELELAIHRLLAKNLAERFQTAEEVTQVLKQIEQPADAMAPMPEVIYVLPPSTAVVGDPFADIDVTPSCVEPVNPDSRDAKGSRGAARNSDLREHGAIGAPHPLKNKRVVALASLVLLVVGFFLVRGFTTSGPKSDIKIADVPPKSEPDSLPKVAKVEPPTKQVGPAPKQNDVPPPPVAKSNELTFEPGKEIRLELVKIPAKGKSFLMGSPKEEEGRGKEPAFDPEEQHEVTFGHDFSIGRYEVTQEQYEIISGTNPARWKGPKNPIEMVSWNDAQAFMKKLNEKFKDSKVKFRLPSEAEWEYACRAGTKTAYNTGKTLTVKQAAFLTGTTGGTKAVGSFPGNAFGLFDMHGNVHEWCEDFYGPYSKAPKDGTAQLIKQQTENRVLRGGGYNYAALSLRSAYRSGFPMVGRYATSGFRVAVDIAVDSPVLAKKGPPVFTGTEVIFDLGNNVKLEVVRIAAKGKSFLMGSPKDEEGSGTRVTEFDREEQHKVTFGYDFYMGKYEVTQEQYEAVMGINPSRFKGPKNPVEMVTWNEAQDFINKLNEKFKDRKLKFRLPSEAEWEFACRAGTTTPYSFGMTLNNQQAQFNFSKVGSPRVIGTTKPIGSFPPNSFGLYDMHGNVNEYCDDFYGPYSKAPSDGTAQVVRQSSELRIRRGGSYLEPSSICRSANRFPGNTIFRSPGQGLRVVALPRE